jgi:hypothetical protein
MARAICGIGLVAIVTFLACGGGGENQQPGKTPTGARASCSADADCALTNDEGGACCAPCAGSPRAIPQLAYEQHKNKCAAVDCKEPSSDRVECPKVEPMTAFHAKCKEGTCAAVKK